MRKLLVVAGIGLGGADIVYRCFVRKYIRKAIGYDAMVESLEALPDLMEEMAELFDGDYQTAEK